MASCSVEIVAGLTSGDSDFWPQVVSGVFAPVAFSNTIKAKLRLASTQSETITCDFVMTSNVVTTTIAFFRVTGPTTAVSEGVITINDSNTTFQKDLIPGDYVLCFSTPSGSMTGNFKATYAGYVSEIRMQARAYHGSAAASSLSTFKPERACNEPMTFWFLDGELPPGCELLENGSIQSVKPLPENDTLADYPPSITWFHDNSDGLATSLPRRWTFRAVVQLVNFPDKWKVETFHIDVHNNWTLDRDAFMREAAAEFDRVDLTEVTEPAPTVAPIEACVCPVEETVSRVKVIQPVEELCGCDVPASPSLDDVVATTPELAAFLDKARQSQKVKGITAVAINTTVTPSTSNERSAEDVDYQFLEIANNLRSKQFPLVAFMSTGEALTVSALT